MSKLTTLITGAGIVTTVTGQSQLDSNIIFGDVDTAVPISGLSIEVEGKSFINITGVQTLLAAWAKWKMKAIQGAAVVGMMLRVATGVIPKNTTYKFTNGGATTPDVYVNSDADNGSPVEAATFFVNPNSNTPVTKFSVLFIQTPANVTSCDVVYSNGKAASLTMLELDAIFAAQYDSEANGQLGGVSVIDNSDKKWASIRINTGATGVTCLLVKLPDAVFKILNP